MAKPNKKQPQNQPRRNHQIKADKVRVIDKDGNNAGIFNLGEALKMAEEAGLDLIEVTAKAEPPVAKIMDYGKYIYQQEKKEREAKKRQKKSGSGEMKGVRLGMQTDTHDLKIKAQRVDKFLKKGYKVRVELQMRGREKALEEMANKKVDEFLNTVTEKFIVEQKPQKGPRGRYLILSPEKEE